MALSFGPVVPPVVSVSFRKCCSSVILFLLTLVHHQGQFMFFSGHFDCVNAYGKKYRQGCVEWKINFSSYRKSSGDKIQTLKEKNVPIEIH